MAEILPEAASPQVPESLRLGPLQVRASAAEVEAFRRETLAPGEATVPFTFPIRWFTHPEIRNAGAKLVGPEPWVPIHESQSFDYERPLAADHDYEMHLEIIREADPARLVLRAEIGDAAPCLRVEMILRIIPLRALESR